eukprot:11199089-Lingulodinium_polyedra.AAC.1
MPRGNGRLRAGEPAVGSPLATSSAPALPQPPWAAGAAVPPTASPPKRARKPAGSVARAAGPR